MAAALQLVCIRSQKMLKLPPGDHPVLDQPKPLKECFNTIKQRNCSEKLKYLLRDLDELIVHTDLIWFSPDIQFTIAEEWQQKVYYICNTRNEQMLSASMESEFCTRVGFGRVPSSSTDMKMLYQVDGKHDAMHLFRSLNCDACCLPCAKQEVEIFSPPLELVGVIEQKWNLLNAEFNVKNDKNEILLHIVGQNMKMDMYKILNLSGEEVGTIRLKPLHIYTNDFSSQDEVFCLYFLKDMNVDVKILLLGATLLIECMHAEAPKFMQNHKRLL